MSEQKSQALAGSRTFEVVVSDAAISIDGESVSYLFEKVGDRQYVLTVGDKSVYVVIERETESLFWATVNGTRRRVRVRDQAHQLLEQFRQESDASVAVSRLCAPMPGLVLAVHVKPGQHVKAGAGLLVLEAMKMENELRADADGIVKSVHVASGEAVAKGDLLIAFE